MRTTLDIEDDVLFAAKEVAKREKKPWARWSANGLAVLFKRHQLFSVCKNHRQQPRGHWRNMVFFLCRTAA